MNALPYSEKARESIYEGSIHLLFKVAFITMVLRLIQVKRAAGHPKDFEVIAELEAIFEEQKKQKISEE